MYKVINEIKEVRHYSKNHILLLNDDIYLNNSKIFVIDKSRKILQKEKVIILDSLNKGCFVENDSNDKIMNHEFRVLSFTNSFIGFYKYGEKKLNIIYSLSIN